MAPRRSVLTPTGASGAIVEGLTLRRGVACYRELLRILLFFYVVPFAA
jgi:hypothetical protein